ncbi:MAG: SIMPL domain-containing protein [Acidobacteriota bacterium]
MFRLPVLFAAAALACSAYPARAQTPASPPVIVTRGEASVKRAPDQAWLTVATETRDVRAEEARRKSAEATTAVQAALKATGLAADAIRTTGYTLAPETEWNNGRSTVKGYLVRNQIEVRVDDLAKLGAVIDAANATKSTALTISGPRFGLKDQDAAEADALRAAVQGAMARAQAMAGGARRTLGNIVRIEDQSSSRLPQPQPMFRMAAAAQGAPVETPITPGEIEVRAEVSVTVELK